MSCIPVSISKNELKDLYEKKKLTTYEIADIYYCCQGTIWKRLKEYGIKRLPNGRRSFVISKSKLRDLYIKAYYSLGNYNRNLLSQIREHLIRNEIRCSKLTESKTKGRLCFGKYFHNQNYWHFRIYAKDSLLTLFKSIDLYLKHAQKRKDVKIAKQNIALRNKLFRRK